MCRPLLFPQGGDIHVASHYRLQGLCIHRLKLSTKSWVKITPEDFKSVTGRSRRQFFYAKRTLEQWKDAKVVFRTVLKQQGRGWEILVSYSGHYLFTSTGAGKDRRTRSNLRQQPATECNHYRGLPTEGRKLTPTLRDLVPSQAQIRLAHVIKRDLEVIHWDNCKVKYLPGMAFVFARDMIALSQEKSEIVRQYEIALSHFHGVATDLGCHFEPSSTVNRARSVLSRKELTFSAPTASGQKNRVTGSTHLAVDRKN